MLLLVFVPFLTSQLRAQSSKVFCEHFDPPSGPDSVTIGNQTSGTITSAWNDTSFLSTSGTHSFHVQGKPTAQKPYFDTDPFSTVGKPYVTLSFNQIAKLFPANQARVLVSIDNGVTWDTLDGAQYRGESTNFGTLGYFNAGSYAKNGVSIWKLPPANYVVPDSTWWRAETFDLTGVASDTTVPGFAGYANVIVRFIAEFNFPAGTSGYSPGWFIDDVCVEAASCELNPPQVTFNFTPTQCYPTNPQGPLVADTSGDYPVGVVAFDNASIFDTGIDSVALYYQLRTSGAWGALQGVNMPNVPLSQQGVAGEYRGYVTGLGIGDTVRYYVIAYDNGCPNETRVPPTFTNGGYYTFWVDSALPAKCGQPFCNQYPTLIRPNPTWVLDFEGSEWVAGTGTGDPGSTPPAAHRGTFPTFPDDYYTISPSPANPAGWSIRTGGTSTSFTGPNDDHTQGPAGGGKYLYLESSQKINNIPPASVLTTPCIDLTGPNPCLGLEYYYHMFGSDIDKLEVAVDTGADQPALWLGYDRILGQQQSSSSDNWQRAILSLEPFKGKIIRLQFLAFNRHHNPNGSTKGDIAIDDIKVFVPDPVDIEVLENPFPVNGYCSYSINQDVQINLRNNGCQTANSIPIAFQVTYNGTARAIKRDTIIGGGLLLGDDTTGYVFDPAKADFSQPGTYQVKVWSEMPGDVDHSNDTVLGPVIQVIPAITSFPYVEDFENAVPGTQTLNSSDFFFEDGLDPAFKWMVGTGMTTTRSTGPYTGFYWKGNYLYSEGGGSSQAVSTFVRTICLDLSGMTKPTLDFLYHAYGGQIEKLVVQVSEGDEDLKTWTTLPTSQVTSTQAGEVTDWKLRRVDLSQYTGTSIKLRFKMDRLAGGQATDLAIDNITVYDLLATDAGAFSLTWPNRRGVASNNTVPQVDIINYGKTSLNDFTVHVDVTPLCGPNQGQTVQYSQSFTNQNILPATTKNLTLTGANVVFPTGESNIKVYTTATGDTYNFNDTIDRNVVGPGKYMVPNDFADDFDDCNYSKTGFMPGGPGLLQWELGTPSYGQISSARSAPNAWVTNLDGPFLIGTQEILSVPILDSIDTIAKAEFRFYQNIDMGNSAGASDFVAAGTVRIFDQGQWKPLGFVNQNIGVNWFASKYGAPATPNIFGQQPAFVYSTNGQWIYSMWPLDQYYKKTGELLFRFDFKSDGSKSQAQAGAGWGIDDFEIYVPPQNSASPVDVTTINPLPFPGFDQEFEVTVMNTGGKNLDSCTTSVYVDGKFIGSQTNTFKNLYRADCDTINGVFRCSPRARFKFTAGVWPAADVTSGPHEVCIITSRPNSKPDAKPVDDTLCKTIVVFDEVDLTDVGIDEYCNDFEGTDPNITDWVTTNVNYEGPTSWERGTPVQFDSAYSGSKVWMTDLDEDYKLQDKSALYTPIFLVDSGRTYEMDFYHWFRTEQYHDGGNVEFTEDGGQTWWPIGWAVKGKPWYNTAFVTALDQIRPGWTDTTAGWENANLTMKFENPTKLIFRFRFGSDQDIENYGWAIDNFCYRKADTLGAQVQIGQEEHEWMPEEAVVGLPTPNPANHQTELSILYPTPTDMSVRVYDMLGQLVEERDAHAGQGVTTLQFNTSSWRPGMYFINLEHEGETITRKLVIAR